MKYSPALDGLRAVAVSAVIAYHCSRDYLPGGSIGVDIFFVLSGFLITSLLMTEFRQTGTIAFKEFYIRRAMRLWPPLLVMLAAFLVSAPFLFPETPALAEAIFAGLYLSDYSKALLHTPRILGHTWSLAVEEHYYLLWPVVVLLIARRWPAHAFAILATGFVAATAWRHADALLWQDYNLTYYRFDTRMSGLLLGSAIAVLPWRPQQGAANGLAGVGILGILWCFIALQWDTLPPLLYGGIVADLAAGCIVLSLAATGATVLGRALSWPPIVYIGAISYSLYLWHYPIVRAMRDNQDPLTLTAVVVVASLVLSALSFELLEKPMKAMRHRRAQTRAGQAPANGSPATGA